MVPFTVRAEVVIRQTQAGVPTVADALEWFARALRAAGADVSRRGDDELYFRMELAAPLSPLRGIRSGTIIVTSEVGLLVLALHAWRRPALAWLGLIAPLALIAAVPVEFTPERLMVGVVAAAALAIVPTTITHLRAARLLRRECQDLQRALVAPPAVAPTIAEGRPDSS